MKFRPLQSALRELHAVFADPRALAVILAVGVIAGLTGPFNTFEVLDLPARLVYWIAIAFGTYAAGLLGGMVLQGWLLPDGRPLWLKVVLSSLGASAPVTALVVAVNSLFFPEGVFSGWAVLWLYFYCLLVCLALMTVIEAVLVPAMAEKTGPATPPAPPPILDRLPPGARGKLRYLSMADHYVEVVTTKGRELVLMRFSDAISETRGIEGFQVHRSHWVASDAIAAVRRSGNRTVVELDDGTQLPVSRTFLSPLRAALSRTGAATTGGMK